jgi:toxin ParE1/3/4
VSYRVAYLPEVAGDLGAIERWLDKYTDSDTTTRRLLQMAQTINFITDYPHAYAIRDDVAPGLRAVPAAEGRAVLTFFVNDDQKEVMIIAATYAGADWIGRSRIRLIDERD